MKTAYELAMDRLNKTGAVAKLSEKQRKQLAELDSLYASRLAEREILARQEMEQAAARGDQEVVVKANRGFADEKRRLQAELEEKKEKVRSGA